MKQSILRNPDNSTTTTSSMTYMGRVNDYPLSDTSLLLKQITDMGFSEKKIINIPTVTMGKSYDMKTCVTRVFKGWLFVEVDGGENPINWFVSEK